MIDRIPRRTLAIALAGLVVVALAVAGLGLNLGWFGSATVKVKTGERVVCTYGETISESIIMADVPREDASQYGVRTKTVLCARHAQLEKLYAQAQDALSRNDTSTALAKLKSVVEGDAKFGLAAAQITDIEAGKTPAPDATPTKPGGSDTGATPKPGAGDGTPTGPVASLLKWVPDSLSGFKAGKVIADPVSLSREYLPISSSAPLAVLVIDAEQRSTAADALSGARQLASSSYPDARADVKINGKSAAFGADGRGFAIVAVADGPVLVVFEGRVREGSTDSLRDELIRIARLVVK